MLCLEIGQRVRCTIDGTFGTVVYMDHRVIRVQWDDGASSSHPLRDGFVLFVVV